MKIDEIHLLTSSLAHQRDFYSKVLQLPLFSTPDNQLGVQAGKSRLIFSQASADWSGLYHVAFNIPENQFAEAKAWLSGRVPLLKNTAGVAEIYSERWNAHSLYFYDPAGNILELIARHTLTNHSSMPFGWQSLECISEIGIVTDDVLETVQRIQESLGFPIYTDLLTEVFASIGDEQGLFIVVKQGRIWMPDTGIPAEASPLTVMITGETGEQCQLSGPPYRLTHHSSTAAG